VASVALALATAASDGTRKQTDIGKSILDGSNVPAPVRKVLQRACQNCHSDKTNWPWYAHIPPMSRQIRSDVAKARAFMDLSRWNEYTDGQRRGFMVAIGASIQSHRMPPAQYVWMHPGARLSSNELELIKSWASAKNGAKANALTAQPLARLPGR
jgi:hypothetical protein